MGIRDSKHYRPWKKALLSQESHYDYEQRVALTANAFSRWVEKASYLEHSGTVKSLVNLRRTWNRLREICQCMVAILPFV